jgi:hypothetical protein
MGVFRGGFCVQEVENVGLEPKKDRNNWATAQQSHSLVSFLKKLQNSDLKLGFLSVGSSKPFPLFFHF